MARRFCSASVAGVSTGTALKTIIQLVAPADQDVALTEWKIGFHGVNNTAEPIKVQLVRQTTAGTMSALTPRIKDGRLTGSTLRTTAQHTATAEPTTTDILDSWTIHPQTSGGWQWSEKTEIVIGATQRVGLIVTAANTVACDATLDFEE